ncbi:hypothetical protein L218DRAFT_1076711 [Marasmius fiardii PR-910]|nr:hypothetical protein L218DRAFT_1076711 [Marasmius fiardii PR-910]
MPADSPTRENAVEKPVDSLGRVVDIVNTISFQTKKRKSDAVVDSTSGGENDPALKPKEAKKNASASSSSDKGTDLFSISLPGDEDGTVEIYDSCNEVCRKINAHLKSSITKTQFLRDIVRAAYPESHSSINIQSKQLGDFLTKKGATAGGTSKVFYAAYVFFEKKRLSKGKGKTKHRLDMEAEWGGGMPRERERERERESLLVWPWNGTSSEQARKG